MNAVKEVDKGNNRPYVTSSPSNRLESIEDDYIATNSENPLYGKLIENKVLREEILYFI
jgi:hypothetical protein